jgi:hypothetical protein
MEDFIKKTHVFMYILVLVFLISFPITSFLANFWLGVRVFWPDLVHVRAALTPPNKGEPRRRAEVELVRLKVPNPVAEVALALGGGVNEVTSAGRLLRTDDL